MEVRAALPEMQRLASRIWSRESRHHPGQLSWSAYYGEDLDLGPVELGAVDGEVVGWAWAESESWLELCVDPSQAQVAADLIGWFVDRAPEGDLSAMVLETEQHLLAALADAGFIAGNQPWFTHHHLDLARLEAHRSVARYAFRHVEPEEAVERSACHRAAWSDFGTSRVTAAAYAGLMRAPYYRHDLDWVAVDRDGEMVASVCLWLDPATGVALVEPVGCAPEHRGRGLAGAVSLAALHAARDLGTTSALVCPRGDEDYPVPGRVYREIGFRPGARTITLTRPATVERSSS